MVAVAKLAICRAISIVRYKYGQFFGQQICRNHFGWFQACREFDKSGYAYQIIEVWELDQRLTQMHVWSEISKFKFKL